MSGRIARRGLVFGFFIGLLVWVLASTPALAHHKDGHEGGKGSSKGAASVTEDNDTNDGGTPNNLPDEGDNRHPSGKDRSSEGGNSGNQGNSSSDPDDDGRGPDRSNGGADKPDGPGGVDLADQDGNNGCGNDDDFEDDNEGWCGKNPNRGGPETEVEGDEVCDADATMEGTQPCATDDTEGEETPCIVDGQMGSDTGCGSDGSTLEGALVEGDVSITEASGADVLGVTYDNQELADGPAERGPTAALGAQEGAEEGGLMPFTGGAVVPLLLLGLGLVLTGLVVARDRRSDG